MAYIDYDGYLAIYGTCPLTEEEFPVYAELASDLIDSVTRYKIQRGGLSALPAYTQTLVKKATAAQILYTYQYGMESTMTGQAGQGFTVGKVHVDSGKAEQTAAQMMISPAVSVYLEQSGLMERSVECLDQYRSSYLGVW